MQTIITSRNTRVPNGVKELASEKIGKVQRLFDRIQTLEIEFSEEHNPRIADKHVVEVILTTKAHVLRAHAAGPDPVSAVDRVSDKLEQQVARLKGRFTKRGARARGKLAVESKLRPYEEMVTSGPLNGSVIPLESASEEGTGSAVPVITKTKRFPVKPMTAQEAALQMDMLGHAFFLFVDAETEQASVVYRRQDGSFGVIAPD